MRVSLTNGAPAACAVSRVGLVSLVGSKRRRRNVPARTLGCRRCHRLCHAPPLGSESTHRSEPQNIRWGEVKSRRHEGGSVSAARMASSSRARRGTRWALRSPMWLETNVFTINNESPDRETRNLLIRSCGHRPRSAHCSRSGASRLRTATPQYSMGTFRSYRQRCGLHKVTANRSEPSLWSLPVAHLSRTPLSKKAGRESKRTQCTVNQMRKQNEKYHASCRSRPVCAFCLRYHTG
jgi:hypothetical protein